jgi:hypothetical protein
MIREIFLEYRESGVLTTAYQVTLASEDGLWGIRRLTDYATIIPTDAPTGTSSTGVYTYTYNFDADTVYQVSWKIIAKNGEEPRYFVDQIGPFPQDNDIRAVADVRGTFVQGEESVMFLSVSNMDGDAVEAESINYIIRDSSGNTVLASTPIKINTGVYVADWQVPDTTPVGKYDVLWFYTVNGEARQELQEIIISAKNTSTFAALYDQRVQEFRLSLSLMLGYASRIPVYREPAQKSRDLQTFEFTFPRWNQSAGAKIYRNNKIVTSGIEINYAKGTVKFDYPLTKFDKVDASYNFRWFSDDKIDRFLSNSIDLYNLWTPVSRTTLISIGETQTPVIMYGALVDALRSLIMDLQFVETQLVFGGADAAAKAAATFESLKKNYEDTWNKALDQKKLGPYKGLTRMVTVPTFALPGSRSRWFRYMFSGSS